MVWKHTCDWAIRTQVIISSARFMSFAPWETECCDSAAITRTHTEKCITEYRTQFCGFFHVWVNIFERTTPHSYHLSVISEIKKKDKSLHLNGLKVRGLLTAPQSFLNPQGSTNCIYLHEHHFLWKFLREWEWG